MAKTTISIINRYTGIDCVAAGMRLQKEGRIRKFLLGAARIEGIWNIGATGPTVDLEPTKIKMPLTRQESVALNGEKVRMFPTKTSILDVQHFAAGKEVNDKAAGEELDNVGS